MNTTSYFQAVTCNRCGGSGSYSWNAVHGSKCYGCGGCGYKYTKAGAAAQRYFAALLSKPAFLLKVGDRVRLDMGLSLVWATLVAIQKCPTTNTMTLTALTNQQESLRTQVMPDTLVRIEHTAAQKQTKAAQALEYQSALLAD